MIGDFFTKPLQEKDFYQFRDLVMGIELSLENMDTGDPDP